MGQRLGGVINVTADGLQLAARGNWEVSPSRVKREGVAGQDGVHGYTEMPVVPGIKGDVTTTPDTSLTDLEAITDATVQVSLANGKTYVLSEAWTKAAFTIGTTEGKFGIEFEGTSCDEV